MHRMASTPSGIPERSSKGEKMSKHLIRKVFVLRLIAVLAIASGALASIQFPIMKMTTPNVVTSIEKMFVRSDLTKQEKEQYNFYKGLILGNERQLEYRLRFVSFIAVIGMPILGIVLILSTMGNRQNKKDSSNPSSPDR